MRLSYTQCCGLRELGEVLLSTSPESYLTRLGKWIWGNPDPNYAGRQRFRYGIFSQAYRLGNSVSYGENLSGYISKHGLGSVIQTTDNENPNSGNQLKVFVWTIDWPAFKSHFDQHLMGGKSWKATPSEMSNNLAYNLTLPPA